MRPPGAERRNGLSLAAAGAAAALAVGFELVRPVVSGPVGFDTAASVIHFQRITSGRHLEAFITATPKPLLTLVDGVLFALTGDWRAISVSSIVLLAVAVVLGGWLGWRLAGPFGGFVTAVGLLASRSLLSDVAISYATPLALVLWLVAGLAVTASPRRYGLAGVALGLATLARLETIVVLGLAAVVLAALEVDARRRGAPGPGRAWLVLVGLLAMPVLLLHDWLLTGDPLFWMSVSAHYSAAAPDSVLAPFDLVRVMVPRYLAMPVATVFAAIGLLDLARRRGWPSFVGLLGLTAGVAAFLVLLAVRHTYVSNRYFFTIDVALVVAAGVGAGAAVRWLQGRLRPPSTASAPRGMALVALGLALAIGVAISWPPASVSTSLRSLARSQLLAAEHADRALPVVSCLLDAIPDSRSLPTDASLERPRAGGAILVVPTLERPRFAVDAGLPLDRVGGTGAAALVAGDGFLPDGRIVVHDATVDLPVEAFRVLEVTQPTAVGGLTIVPVLADPTAGLWVLWIVRPGVTGPPPCG